MTAVDITYVVIVVCEGREQTGGDNEPETRNVVAQPAWQSE